MKTSLRYATPTVAVRDIDSRAVEIRMDGDESKPIPNFDFRAWPWAEFRRLVLVFAFENRDVTLLINPESFVLKTLGVSVRPPRSSILLRAIEAVVPRRFTGANRTTNVDDVPDSSSASLAHLDHQPDQIIELRDDIVALRWKCCAADTLSEIADQSDFELSQLFVTTLGDAVAERYADLYCDPDSDPASRQVSDPEWIPATADEAFYCTGDSDGTVMRWLNPGIQKEEIVDRIKLMCKIFSWKCRVSEDSNTS